LVLSIAQGGWRAEGNQNEYLLLPLRVMLNLGGSSSILHNIECNVGNLPDRLYVREWAQEAILLEALAGKKNCILRAPLCPWISLPEKMSLIHTLHHGRNFDIVEGTDHESLVKDPIL
jgi:hypothetical protein